MHSIRITITGTAPLMCGRPVPDDQPMQNTPVEQAKARLYLDATGRPTIPSHHVVACLMAAVRVVVPGVRLMDAISVPDPVVIIRHRQPWVVDTRTVRNPRTDIRMLCHRPRFDDWSLAFTLMSGHPALDQDSLRQVVDLAGQRIGLGEYRRERGGPFGMFTCTRWVLT